MAIGPLADKFGHKAFWYEFDEGALPYRLLYPKNYDPNKSYPVILTSHGSSEAGGDNISHVSHAWELAYHIASSPPFNQENYSWTFLYDREDLECFVISPQIPTTVTSNIYSSSYHDGKLGDLTPSYHPDWEKVNENGWYTSACISLLQNITKNDFKFYTTDSLDTTVDYYGLNTDTFDKLNFDQNRIYFTGFSYGGKGSFEILKQGRDIFAGCLVCDGWAIGGAYSDPYITDSNNENTLLLDRLEKEISRWKHIPVFMMGGTSGMKDNMKAVLDVLSDLGGKGYLCVEGGGHGWPLTERSWGSPLNFNKDDHPNDYKPHTFDFTNTGIINKLQEPSSIANPSISSSNIMTGIEWLFQQNKENNPSIGEDLYPSGKNYENPSVETYKYLHEKIKDNIINDSSNKKYEVIFSDNNATIGVNNEEFNIIESSGKLIISKGDISYEFSSVEGSEGEKYYFYDIENRVKTTFKFTWDGLGSHLLSFAEEVDEVDSNILRTLNCGIYVLSPHDKYTRDEIIIDGKNKAVLTCGQNDIRSFQILITNESENENIPVNLRVKNETDEIPSFTLYREHFVETTESTYMKNYEVGFYPDGLIPFTNPNTGLPLNQNSNPSQGFYSAYDYEIGPRENCPYWIDVDTTGIKSGKYSNEIIVEAEGVEISVPVTIEVYPVILPEKHDFKIQMSSPRSALINHYDIENSSDPNWQILSDNVRKTFYKTGVYTYLSMYSDAYASANYEEMWTQKTIDKYRQQAEEYGCNSFLFTMRYRNTYDRDTDTYTQTTAENRENRATYLSNLERLVNENSWITTPSIYYDEPNHIEAYHLLWDYAEDMKKYCPSINLLVTEQVNSQFKEDDPSNPNGIIEGYPDGLKGAVDIWCPLIDLMDINDLQERIALGEEGWSYTALAQVAPTYGKCNLHLDGPLIHYTAPMWVSYNLNLTGFLYWGGCVYWEGGSEGEPINPWENSEYKSSSYVWNGEGNMVYPSTDVGYDYDIIPSMRLLNFREGLQDWKLFKILEEKVGKEKVKEIISGVASSYDNFSKNSSQYEFVRRKIMLMIHDFNEDRHYIESSDNLISFDKTKQNNKFRLVPEEKKSFLLQIENNDFTISGEESGLIWDKDGNEEYTFTYEGEFIFRRINNSIYKITYEGEGSYLFSIEIYKFFYKEFSDLLADIYDNSYDILDSMESMLSNLELSKVSSNDPNKNVLKENIIYTKNNMEKFHQSPTQNLLNILLNFQLLFGKNSEEINNYLQTYDIKVRCSFAYLSSLVGFIIDIDNIEDVEYCNIFFEVGE